MGTTQKENFLNQCISVKFYLKINTSFKISCQTSPDQLSIRPSHPPWGAELPCRVTQWQDRQDRQMPAQDELPADHSWAEEAPVPWKSVLSPQSPHFPEQKYCWHKVLLLIFFRAEYSHQYQPIYCVLLKKNILQRYFNTEAFLLLITALNQAFVC